MSKKLGISISYLSAIENGTREIPTGFVEKISEVYHLSEKEKEALSKAEENSANKVSISLQETISQQRQLAFTLSRRLKDLSPDECNKIIEYMGGSKDDR